MISAAPKSVYDFAKNYRIVLLTEAKKKSISKKEFVELLHSELRAVIDSIPELKKFGQYILTGSTSIKIRFLNIPNRGEASDKIRLKIYNLIKENIIKNNLFSNYKFLLGKTRSAKTSIGSAEIDFLGKNISFFIKGQSTEATDKDTDIKESTVVLFSEMKIIKPLKTEVDFENLMGEINDYLNQISVLPGETSNVKEKLKKYFLNLQYSKNTINVLNQAISISSAINEVYAGTLISRNKLFNAVRAQGKKIARIPPDKWNPGDIYLVNKILDESEIQQITQINDLNNLFVDKWGSKDRPLVSISLKQEKAQAGKAKALLERYAKIKDDYNLTKTELNFSEIDFIKNIEKLREKLKKFISVNDKITYKLESGKIAKDKLRGKYAALKAITFLLSHFQPQAAETVPNPPTADEALLALAGFALSLTTINPSFFKLTAKKSGERTVPDPFGQGYAISLIDETEVQPITIIDTPTAGGIQIEMYVLKMDEPYKVFISAREKGYTQTQGTIDVEKFTKIG